MQNTFIFLVNYLLPSYGSFCEGSKQIHQSWVGIVSRTHKWLEKNYHNHQFTNPWIYHLHVKLTFNNSIHANKLTAWLPCGIKQTILHKTKSMITNPSLIQKLEKRWFIITSEAAQRTAWHQRFFPCSQRHKTQGSEPGM